MKCATAARRSLAVMTAGCGEDEETGDGAATGEPIKIGAIVSLTGETSTGKLIMRNAADTLKRVHLLHRAGGQQAGHTPGRLDARGKSAPALKVEERRMPDNRNDQEEGFCAPLQVPVTIPGP